MLRFRGVGGVEDDSQEPGAAGASTREALFERRDNQPDTSDFLVNKDLPLSQMMTDLENKEKGKRENMSHPGVSRRRQRFLATEAKGRWTARTETAPPLRTFQAATVVEPLPSIFRRP